MVVPLSTLPNWERELTKWAPGMYTVSLKGNADARRTIRKFDAHLDAGGRKRREAPVRFSVMLITYEVMQQARVLLPACCHSKGAAPMPIRFVWMHERARMRVTPRHEHTERISRAGGLVAERVSLGDAHSG